MSACDKQTSLLTLANNCFLGQQIQQLMEGNLQPYTDWSYNGNVLPLYVEGSSIIDQDDVWSELLRNTPSMAEDVAQTTACTDVDCLRDAVQPPNWIANESLSRAWERISNSDVLNATSHEFMKATDALCPRKNGQESLDITNQHLVSSTPPQTEPTPQKKVKMSHYSVLEEDEMEKGLDHHTERGLNGPHLTRSEFKEISNVSAVKSDQKWALPIIKGRTSTGAPPMCSRGRANQNITKESRWAEQLLGACAVALASKNMIRTQHFMWVLNDLASPTGDANQRLAAHGLKALFHKVIGAEKGESLHPGAVPRPVHRALLAFHDASPWYQLAYTIANGALLEACDGHKNIHVLDIGISQGTQWPTFIEALATRPSGPPVIMRLTTVNHQMCSSSTEFFGRLQPFASTLGLKLELQHVSSSLEALTGDELGLRDGEALFLCAQFRLHHLYDEVKGLQDMDSDLSLRDSFLKFLHQLKPELFVLSENDADHGSPDFPTRFQKVAEFYWKFLNSTSASFKGRDCEERQIIEHEAAIAMLNNVACEGSSRIERNESHESWSTRMVKAGFTPSTPRTEMIENAKVFLRKYDSNWDLLLDGSCMILRWKGQSTTFCSVWKP